MKDCTKEELENSRPLISADEAISHCLNCLYRDKRHAIEDYVSPNLTYEELIGALLLARDEIDKPWGI